MQLKRAIWMGFLSYIASFMFGIITATLLGLDLTSPVETTTQVWILGIIASIIIMTLFSFWYFKKVEANAKEGFYFGLVAVIVAFIIEGALIIPYIMITDAPSDIYSYYANPLFWLTVVFILVTTSLVGWYKGRYSNI